MINFEKELKNFIHNNYKVASEEEFEKALICYLEKENNYIYRNDLETEEDLIQNFKKKIEELNNFKFLDREFEGLMNDLNSGDVFEKLKKSRFEKISIKRNGKFFRDLNIFDFKNIENNSFEIINQFTTNDKNNDTRRFDVNILVNGLPTIHIELKKENITVENAIRQIGSYKKKKASSGFLDFTRIFIASNNLDTRYIANNNLEKFNSEYSFKWGNEKNQYCNVFINDKNDNFCKTFLDKKILLNIIQNYFVYDTDNKEIKVLRYYQYHAAEKVIERVKNNGSGYVWHATGSGKTLTSFKVCELLTRDVKKIIFLIDRKVLNKQTFDEFKKFTIDNDFIKNATNKNDLLNMMKDPLTDNKIIISTIQKLNAAVKDLLKNKSQEALRDEKILFIVDEGHRSQLGLMRRNINKFFKKSINIAFTGTPIFDKNSEKEGETTEKIFGEEIHRYTSKDAIEDGNVLEMFYEEYICEIQKKNNKKDDDSEKEAEGSHIEVDIGRINDIGKKIEEIFDKTTHNKTFNAMLACSNIEEAKAYWNFFNNSTNIKSKIVYSITNSDYTSREEISEANKDFLLERMKEQNPEYKEIEKFDQYKTDIQKSFSNTKKINIDLLIVVSMFLTGFDSPRTKVLFLDKNLKYHGLIQAMSRTNRLFKDKKQGHIVSFSKKRKDVDEAFELFTNGGLSTISNGKWKMVSFKEMKNELEIKWEKLIDRYPDPEDVPKLKETSSKEKFMSLFREVEYSYKKIKSSIEYDDKKIKNFEIRTFEKFKSSFNGFLEDPEMKKVIPVYHEYRIIDGDKITINSKYLENLMKIKTSEELEKLINNLKQKSDRELVKGFWKDINEKGIVSVEDRILYWKNWIKKKEEEIEKKAIKNWKTTSEAINQLIKNYQLKDNEYRKDNAEELLGNYFDSIIDRNKKHDEVKETIIDLINLRRYIKEGEYFNN